MSAFWTIRSAVLPSILAIVMPSVSRGTTNPRTSFVSRSRAQTTTMSANVALPIQRLSPSSTHSSPSRRAVVRMPPATSEPPSGSVSPNAPIVSIRAIEGSQRCRCSSVPPAYTEPIARPVWMPKKLFTDGSTRAISACRKPRNRRRAGSVRPSPSP